MHIDNEKRLLSFCTKYLIRVSRYYANHTITLITLDLCKLVNVCTDSYECYGVLGIKRTRLKRFTQAHIITEYAMQWYSIMIDGMLYILKSSSVKEAETAFKHLTDNLKDEIDENRTDVLSERSETTNGETQKSRKDLESENRRLKQALNTMYGVGDIFQTPENSERSEGGESNDSPSVSTVST